MVFTAPAMVAFAEGEPVEFAGGTGTVDDPYQIETAEQLDAVRNDLSAHYVLNSDIVFNASDFSSSGQFYNDGKGWNPIGNSSEPFTGSLNGNGKTISGINLNADIMYAGLFGYISNATISDLCVEGDFTVESASSEAYVGSIAGYNNGGRITGCTNLSTVSSSLLSTTSSSIHYVGGVVGYNKGTLTTCTNNQVLSCENIYSYLGGIAGMSTSTVSNCSNDAAINGKEYVGGITGSGNCSNCENTGDITNSGNPSPKNALSIYAGGITGNGNCSDCLNEGEIYAAATYKPVEIGGISGSGTVSNSDNAGKVTGDNQSSAYGDIHAGGIVGSGVASYCRNYGHIIGAGAGSSAYTYVGGIVGYGYSNATTYSSNSGRVELNTNRSYSYAGGIGGAYAHVKKSYNTGMVIGRYAGGISGLGRSSTDCFNIGIVKSNKGCAGGITGKLNYQGTMTNCYNIGSVQSSQGTAGGLSGANDSGTITNCYYLNRIDIGVAGDPYLGTSCSLEEMKDQTTFSGFDFDAVWSINPEATYPLPVLNGVAEVEDQNNLPMSDSIVGMTVIGLNASYGYTGNPIEPSVSIEGLQKNVDYRVSYKNNVDAGTATVTFTGIGDYAGTMNKTFSITPASISSKTINGLDSEYAYTGNPIEPEISISGLELGKDYDVLYENNTEGGTATVNASGKGNYTGTIQATFDIYVPIDISSMSFSNLSDSYQYTGGAIQPDVSIGNLQKNTDYELEFEDNIDVGVATIKATGKKYYTGTLTSTFTIDPLSIASFKVTGLQEVYVQTGSAIIPNISIEGLEKNKDYTVSCRDNIEIGTATLTITGIGNYTDGIVKHFEIVDQDISDRELLISSDSYPYTGDPITPKVTIVGLKQGEDFTVEYDNNVEVGTAEITVKGIGNCVGEKSIDFSITRRSISDSELTTKEQSYIYTGSAIVPQLTVISDCGKSLEEDKDYTVQFNGNTNVGSALIIVTGKGNYKGYLVGSFDISSQSLSDATISGIEDKTYTGGQITLKLTVKVGSRVLAQGSDYTVSYSNNVNVGTASVTVAGKGNYTGSIKRTFKINKANNPLTVVGKKVSLKASALKKKAQTVTAKKAFTVSKAQGKITYKKLSGNKKITVTSAGKINVKKGLKKGTYPIKVKVTAAGTTAYKAGSKTVTVKIIVK